MEFETEMFFFYCSIKQPAKNASHPDFDPNSTLNYDEHDPDIYFGQWGGHIAVNPKYPTIWLVSVITEGMILMDILDGWFFHLNMYFITKCN